MPVRISSNLELPNNAVTQKFAFIARSGAGKSYGAGKLVEGLLQIPAPVIVLDPVGNWYGLRLSASGKSQGFPIPVFGGEHGDLELELERADALAKLLVEQDLSAVLDLSQFRKNERRAFVTQFAESLFFYCKSNRKPRMLVIEEAQVFAPQRTSPGEERMLGAMEDLCRLGRNYGIGTCLISQRPQSINKEVLNQVECLFTGQLNAKHERDAIDGWVAEHKAQKGWTDQLPTLEQGEFIVWSPQWLRILEKVKIQKRTTYDASATPELGQTPVGTKKLTTIDVPALKAALEALAPKPTPRAAAGPAGVELAQLQSQLEQALLENARLEKAIDHERKSVGLERWKVGQELRNVVAELAAVSQYTDQAIAKLDRFVGLAAKVPEVVEGAEPGQSARVPIAESPAEPPPAQNFFLNERQELPTGTALPSSAVAMLKHLVRVHPVLMSKAQLAHSAGIKTTGGHWNKLWKALQDGYLSEGAESGYYTASKKTLALFKVDAQKPPPTFAERVAFWNERLSSIERRILQRVVEAAPGIGVSRELIALQIGSTGTGGFFNSAINTLVRNNLILKQKGVYVVHPWLRG